MGIQQVLHKWRRLSETGEATAWMRLEGQPGDYRDLPDALDAGLVQALATRGIDRLYSHQHQAFDSIRKGENLVVVTPTASGKTLCYNLAVLQRMLEDKEARALYLFPTKALAQDQFAELAALTQTLSPIPGIELYDGDTPSDRRRRIRKQARIVLTNPDMLHTGILPHHPKWIEFFQNLQYVVVDEIHTYRGVFGSHLGNVFRRLKRIARFYNSSIQFIACSATIANPAELASALVEEPVTLIDQSGAPRATKDVILVNPPLRNPGLGLRQSALACARRFARDLLQEGVQTIVFATSRVTVEVLLRYLQKGIPSAAGEAPRIRGYRGGYLPRTRREIERQLREKELLGVVSTNALELGIDIGSLEACVLAGYPGTIASTWQQMGRSGRRRGHSVAMLVARNLPLDQFIVSCPDFFFDRSPERALIHPDHLHILVSHIKCAAFELPFRKGEQFGAEDLQEILAFLAEHGLVTRAGDTWHWSDESYPADSVSLRSLAEENFVVLNLEDGNRAIAEVDFDSAPELIHEGAVYLCEGRQYHVKRLDYSGRKAYVEPVEVDYYTDAITQSRLRVLSIQESREDSPARVEHGDVHLVRKVPGFKKIRFYTGENLGYGKVELPVHELHTMACWFSLREADLAAIGLTRDETILGCLGLSFALHTVATLLVMCDPRDLGRSVGDRSTAWFALADQGSVGLYSSGSSPEKISLESIGGFEPTVFLFDNVPGGIGFSRKLFENHSELMLQARHLIERCGCADGCPSCVGPVNELARKTRNAALRISQMIGTPAFVTQ